MTRLGGKVHYLMLYQISPMQQMTNDPPPSFERVRGGKLFPTLYMVRSFAPLFFGAVTGHASLCLFSS